MHRLLNFLYTACAVLAALFMALIAVLILAQTIGRLFGVVVPDANELAGFAFATLVFLALAPTLRAGGHIRVTLLLSRLPVSLHRWFEIWCLLISLALVGYTTYWMIDLAYGSYSYHDVSTGVLALPLWIPQAGMAFGLIVMTLSLIEILVGVIRGAEPPYAGKEGEVNE